MKKLYTIISIVIGVTMLISIGWTVDSYYAKAERLQLVEQRLEQKITQDRANWVQERIWRLEDRYYNLQMPSSVKEEYRRLKSELKRLQNVK